jgi:hypothetical protein
MTEFSGEERDRQKRTAKPQNIQCPMGTLKNQLPVDFSSRKAKTSFAFAHIFSNSRC